MRNGKRTQALGSEETKFSIAVDMGEGIKYLHSRKIIHRDLKPENVLLRIVDEKVEGRAKLCDFGPPREIRKTVNTNSRNSHELTPLFAPPEEFIGIKPPYNYDLWGYGLLLCWIGGDGRKIPLAPMFNKSELARNGELLTMAKIWAESIENRRLEKCACDH